MPTLAQLLVGQKVMYRVLCVVFQLKLAPKLGCVLRRNGEIYLCGLYYYYKKLVCILFFFLCLLIICFQYLLWFRPGMPSCYRDY